MASNLQKLEDLIEALIQEQSSTPQGSGEIFSKPEYLEDVKASGAAGFLQRIERYGKTDQGDPLILRPWYRDALSLIGDWRIQYVATTGAAQTGKSQPLDEPVLTPEGWVPMGDIKVGSQVICPSTGQAIAVTGVYPQPSPLTIYNVHFGRDAVVRASKDHLWEVFVQGQKSVKDTGEIAALLAKGKKVHIQAIAPVLDISKKPYLFSARSAGHVLGSLFRRGEEVWDRYAHQIIPQYICADILTRIEFFLGLADVGLIEETFIGDGDYRVSSIHRIISVALRDLFHSLGGNSSSVTRQDNPREFIFSGQVPWSLDSLKMIAEDLKGGPAEQRRARKTIKEAKPLYRQITRITVDSSEVDMQCIRVASEESLYVTKHWVRTHNTLANVLAFVDLTIHGRMPIGYVYADKTAMQKFSKSQFRGVAKLWVNSIADASGIQLRKQSDIQGAELYQIGGVAINFAFASTSRDTKSKEGKSIVGGAIASFPAVAVGCDERSRWPSAADASGRTGFSFRPGTIRDIGTPGSGQGIEKLMTRCDRIFIPHFKCTNPGCRSKGAWQPLDPRGCLLLQDKVTDPYGREKDSYFDNTGKPVSWHHHDTSSPVETAFFGCPTCGVELTPAQLSEESRMVCKITGMGVDQFLEELPHDFTAPHKVGVILSPLCRENAAQLARELITTGLECEDGRVWQQENLGIPSTGQTSRLTDEILQPLVGAPWAVGHKPWGTIAGVDYGRSTCWLWVIDIHLPENWRQLTTHVLKSKAIRRVRYGGSVHRSRVWEVCKGFNVTHGGVDAFPDTTWSCNLTTDSGGMFQLVNQIAINDSWKESTLMAGGDTFECLKISNQAFYPQVIQNCLGSSYDGRPSYRFPEDWDRWFSKRTADSPIRHFQGPYFDDKTEAWTRPLDKVDDIFNAAVIAEAILEQALSSGGSVWWSDY